MVTSAISSPVGPEGGARHRWLVGVALAAALPLAACADAMVSSAAKKEPVKVEKVAGTDLTRMTLDAKAVERIGLKLEPVGGVPGDEGGPDRPTVPYAAVLYDAKGATFVYTNPAPLTYIRHAIVVDAIQGNTAVLHAGPPLGTPVVIVGNGELVGIEFGVGK
jgi:hypothetical protein